MTHRRCVSIWWWYLNSMSRVFCLTLAGTRFKVTLELKSLKSRPSEQSSVSGSEFPQVSLQDCRPHIREQRHWLMPASIVLRCVGRSVYGMANESFDDSDHLGTKKELGQKRNCAWTIEKTHAVLCNHLIVLVVVVSEKKRKKNLQGCVWIRKPRRIMESLLEEKLDESHEWQRTREANLKADLGNTMKTTQNDQLELRISNISIFARRGH
jgi:hypothetical protein